MTRVYKSAIMNAMLKNLASYLAWITATIATSGSLYASEIAHLPPCVLCWYQRIFMYPLVIILAVGILKKDRIMPLYVLPLSILGMAFAFYHMLLYYRLLPESAAPCLAGFSCTTKFFEWFGFVTIPFMSFMAFLTIIFAMLILMKSEKR